MKGTRIAVKTNENVCKIATLLKIHVLGSVVKLLLYLNVKLIVMYVLVHKSPTILYMTN